MLEAHTYEIIQWKLGLLGYNVARPEQRQGFTYLSTPTPNQPAQTSQRGQGLEKTSWLTKTLNSAMLQ